MSTLASISSFKMKKKDIFFLINEKVTQVSHVSTNDRHFIITYYNIHLIKHGLLFLFTTTLKMVYAVIFKNVYKIKPKNNAS